LTSNISDPRQNIKKLVCRFCAINLRIIFLPNFSSLASKLWEEIEVTDGKTDRHFLSTPATLKNPNSPFKLLALLERDKIERRLSRTDSFHVNGQMAAF